MGAAGDSGARAWALSSSRAGRETAAQRGGRAAASPPAPGPRPRPRVPTQLLAPGDHCRLRGSRRGGPWPAVPGKPPLLEPASELSGFSRVRGRACCPLCLFWGLSGFEATRSSFAGFCLVSSLPKPKLCSLTLPVFTVLPCVYYLGISYGIIMSRWHECREPGPFEVQKVAQVEMLSAGGSGGSPRGLWQEFPFLVATCWPTVYGAGLNSFWGFCNNSCKENLGKVSLMMLVLYVFLLLDQISFGVWL